MIVLRLYNCVEHQRGWQVRIVACLLIDIDFSLVGQVRRTGSTLQSVLRFPARYVEWFRIQTNEF